jgi:hypothetical protein
VGATVPSAGRKRGKETEYFEFANRFFVNTQMQGVKTIGAPISKPNKCSKPIL